jgi:hypothetical protein
MLSTASALLEATQDGVMNDEAMEIASFITHARHELDQNDFAKAMFMYATTIASGVCDKVTKVLLTKEQFIELIDTIDEMETMRNEVINNGK